MEQISSIYRSSGAAKKTRSEIIPIWGIGEGVLGFSVRVSIGVLESNPNKSASSGMPEMVSFSVSSFPSNCPLSTFPFSTFALPTFAPFSTFPFSIFPLSTFALPTFAPLTGSE